MDMRAYAGQTLGSWRLLRLLGEGAFGAVFEAEHTGIAGRAAAVKILRPELSMQAAIKQRFLNEASAASRAEHENIVQIFDGGITADGTCYSVMEMLRGATLTSVIERGRLDVARAVNVGVQVAGALQAAHALGIVHRDLKPDNLFVINRTANAEFIKVLDFGVAKLRGDQPTDAKLTSTGMVIGTSAYMSPEQWMGRPDIDGRSDVYSLGVILFECLTGVRPFRGTTSYELLIAHTTDPPPDLVGYGVPLAMSRVVQRMLAKDPGLRPQSMREVVQDLQGVLRAVPSASVPVGTQLTAEALTRMTPSSPQPAQPYPQAPQGYAQPAPTAYVQAPGPQRSGLAALLPKLAPVALGALALLLWLAERWEGAPAWVKSILGLFH